MIKHAGLYAAALLSGLLFMTMTFSVQSWSASESHRTVGLLVSPRSIVVAATVGECKATRKACVMACKNSNKNNAQKNSCIKGCLGRYSQCTAGAG